MALNSMISTNNLVILIVVAVIVVFYLIYINLIFKRNTVREALSGVDVQLRKRSDLIPNIIAMAKKYMQYEEGVMTEITELRTKVDKNYSQNKQEDVKDHFIQAETLSSKLGQFMLSVENYPDLKSNQTMIQTMESLNEVEAQIAAARRFYNSAVTALNNMVQIFPINVVGKIVNVQEMPFYQTDDIGKAPVDVGKLIN